jgi:hypothetical protein
MKLFKLVLAAGIVLVVSISGCKSSTQETPAPASQAQPGAATASADGSISGKVVETMNSAGYTYVSVENNGKRTWVALPETKVKVGQEITCQPGMEMQNFTSKTLKRTFASIVFSTGVR